jgi:dolichyl-phosphate beta-glucosyltransferase
MMPTIAVIMPAYNEAERIERTISSIARYVAGGGRIGPVIIADDGSIDDTMGTAIRAAAEAGQAVEILQFPHRGKASTVRSAMLEVAGRVTADYLMLLDADDEIRIDQLDLVEWSADPRTIYIARRVDLSAGGHGHKPSLVRRGMSITMRLATRILLGINFRDTQCGFKLFPRAIVPGLFGQQRSTAWTFDAELLFIADRVSRLPIREVLVVWTPRGASKVRTAAVITSAFAMFGTAWRRALGTYRPVGFATTADPDRPVLIHEGRC